MHRFRRLIAPLVLVWTAGLLAGNRAQAQIPATKGDQIAVFAGGCFWGVDAVFKHVRGVKTLVSGYSGGGATTAAYEVACTGTTGHAESVQITYDPSPLTYAALLRVFSSVAHDRSPLSGPGPAVGTH